MKEDKDKQASKILKILAIESSHDDTSLALYQNKQIIWDQTISQAKFHADFGGTIPEYAARNHVHNFGLLLNELLSNYKLNDVDYIAYTSHPGLIGSLQMGYLFASGLSLALAKPLIPINHLHAHILAVEFTKKITFPALALIVSGGHSQIWFLTSYNDLTLIGETQDDALGEVYDKVARMLNLGFPGGPLIDQKAREYQGELLDFAIKYNKNYNLSFSGLKTKVQNYLQKQKSQKNNVLPAQVAASFQFHAIQYVLRIFKKALRLYDINSIVLGGGVAANSYLREEFKKMHANSLIPELKHTTDNAAMIAIACDLKLSENLHIK